MLHGTPCPQCKKSTIPFASVLAEGEPSSGARCPHCTALLRRKAWVWLLVPTGSMDMALLAGLAIAYAAPRWGALGMAAAGVLSFLTFLLLLNLVGWMMVGWDFAPGHRDRRQGVR